MRTPYPSPSFSNGEPSSRLRLDGKPSRPAAAPRSSGVTSKLSLPRSKSRSSLTSNRRHAVAAVRVAHLKANFGTSFSLYRLVNC
jgi:hypothetical protein